MPLSDEEREKVEETIMDLHFTSQKYIDGSKDIHKKLLEVNVQEAVDILKELQEEIKDDEKKFDYKMHMLLPFQVYELIKIRESKENGNTDT